MAIRRTTIALPRSLLASTGSTCAADARSGPPLLPGLDAVLAYLAQADPDSPVGPCIRETASAFAAASAFSAPAAIAAYGKLAPESRDALTASLADLTARMTARRLGYLRRTSVDAYERALRSLRITVTLDAMFRELARGDRQGMMLTRDAALADTVEWILRREDRIVLAAHNGHVQRWPGTMPGIPAITPMGMHLADRLGENYLVIGTTSGTGHILNTGADFYAGKLFTAMEAPQPGSLDALSGRRAATRTLRDRPTARLSPAVTESGMLPAEHLPDSIRRGSPAGSGTSTRQGRQQCVRPSPLSSPRPARH